MQATRQLAERTDDRWPLAEIEDLKPLLNAQQPGR